MRNRIFCLLLVFFSASVITCAQKITWGPIYKDTTKQQVSKIIGYDANGFYLTRSSEPSRHKPTVLEKYDFSGNKLFGKNLVIADQNSNGDYVTDTVFYLKNSILAFMRTPDLKTSYAVKVNTDGNTDKNKLEVGPIRDRPKKDYPNNNNYHTVVSSDNSSVLAYYRYLDENKISVKVIKDNLTEIWSKEVEIPFEGKEFSIQGAAESGDNTYFLVLVTKGDYGSFEILQYNHTSNNVKKIDANPLEGKFITNLNFKTDNAGNILFSGLYENVKSGGDVGTFLVKLDNNSGNVLFNKTFPFDNDILSIDLSASEIKKGMGMPMLYIKDILVRDDNSILFVTEQNSNSSFHDVGDHTSMASYDYYSAIISKINTDGSLVWTKEIYKRQDLSGGSNSAPFICSFGLSIFGDNIYMIFNDNVKNAQLTAEEVEKNKKNVKIAMPDGGASHQALILETIDLSTGDLKRKELGDQYANSKLLVYANFYLPLSDKVIVYRSDVFKTYNDEGQFGQFLLQ